MLLLVSFVLILWVVFLLFLALIWFGELTLKTNELTFPTAFIAFDDCAAIEEIDEINTAVDDDDGDNDDDDDDDDDGDDDVEDADEDNNIAGGDICELIDGTLPFRFDDDIIKWEAEIVSRFRTADWVNFCNFSICCKLNMNKLIILKANI